MNQNIFTDNSELFQYYLVKFQFLHDFIHILIVSILNNFCKINRLHYITSIILYFYLNFIFNKLFFKIKYFINFFIETTNY